MGKYICTANLGPIQVACKSRHRSKDKNLSDGGHETAELNYLFIDNHDWSLTYGSCRMCRLQQVIGLQL